MSLAPWKYSPARVPLIPSSAISDGDDRVGPAFILGGHGYPPLFDLTKGQLERAIAGGIFPQPSRVQNVIFWKLSSIKEYVQMCENGIAAGAIPRERPVKHRHSPVPDGWSTTPDLVRLLGVTRQTIHTYRKAGKIPEPRRFAVPGRKGYQPAWSPEQMHAILVSMGEEAL